MVDKYIMFINDSVIWISAVSIIYIVSGILLLIRSNTAVICARSVTLIYAIHLGNWLESSFIILLVLNTNLYLGGADKNLWVLHSGIGISHFLVYLPYILRSYRLYIIFVLEANIDDFSESPLFKRTTQKWLLQALLVMICLIAFVYIILTILTYTGILINLYSIDSASISESPYMWIIVFVRFIEQLMLIISIYCIRDVQDDFNMVLELLIVTIINFLTPLSVIFLHFNRGYLWIYIIRNLLLLFTSSIYPVFLSFTRSICYQMLSLSNLYSVELLLLHPAGLNAFEMFLKSYNPVSITEITDGPLRLDLLLVIDCWLLSNEGKYIEKIKEKIDLIGLQNYVEGDLGIENLCKLKNFILKTLEQRYFGPFMKSMLMENLRKEVFRHELLQIRIDQTSLQRPGEKIRFECRELPLDD